MPPAGFSLSLLEKWNEGWSERQDGLLLVLSDPNLYRPSTNGGIDSLAEKEGALTLEATRIQDVDEPIEEVVRGVPVSKNEDLRLLTGGDLFGNLLRLVGKRISAASVRVHQLEMNTTNDDVPLILTEVVHIGAFFGDDVPDVNSATNPPSEIVIARNEVGSDALDLGVVVDDILGLRLCPKGMDFIFLATIDSPTSDQITSVQHLGDANFFADGIKGVKLVEFLVDRTEMGVGDNANIKGFIGNVFPDNLGLCTPASENLPQLTLRNSEFFQ